MRFDHNTPIRIDSKRSTSLFFWEGRTLFSIEDTQQKNIARQNTIVLQNELISGSILARYVKFASKTQLTPLKNYWNWNVLNEEKSFIFLFLGLCTM